MKGEGLGQSGIHSEMLEVWGLLLSRRFEGQHFTFNVVLRRKEDKVRMVTVALHAHFWFKGWLFSVCGERNARARSNLSKGPTMGIMDLVGSSKRLRSINPGEEQSSDEAMTLETEGCIALEMHGHLMFCNFPIGIGFA